jgi:dissimilatory sulfite reductase (desulfoviridin) alpha/beta subunit
MKKVAFICMMCLMALTMRAQKCVVIDLQLGTNVTEEEADACTYEFRSNFTPSNYNMIELEKINGVIDKLGYPRTTMTRQQQREIGRRLEAKIMVIGTVSKFMDEYTLDVQIIDVSTGTTITSENATFQKSQYRRGVRSVAERLIYNIQP